MAKGKNARPMISPVGTIVGFCALQEARPDYNKTADEYSVKVAFEARDFAPFKKQLEKLRERYKADYLDALSPAKRKPIERKMEDTEIGVPEVYPEGHPEEGEETGRMIIRFKQVAVLSGVSKKTGKPYEIEKKIALYDANGNKIKTQLRIGEGSRISVSFHPNAYFMEKDAEFGVSFSRMVGVQIVELVEYEGGEMSAEDAGFGTVEGGYVAPDDDEDEGGFGGYNSDHEDDMDDEIPF